MDRKNLLVEMKISKQFFLLMASMQRQSDKFFSYFEQASSFSFTAWSCKQLAFRLVVKQKKWKMSSDWFGWDFFSEYLAFKNRIQQIILPAYK